MKNKNWTKLLPATALLLLCVLLPVQAAEVDSDAVYCFQSEEFTTVSAKEAELTGVMITGVPHKEQGLMMLGNRVICPGDILTANQLDNMTFQPGENSGENAEISYLPIYGNQVEQEAVMTISINKKENQPPVVENGCFETYKNLENKGTLKATDPEGESVTYTLVKAPKRGEVVLHEDGTFTYTPKKNKVGKDSFTFTATDAKGAVSGEATVSVEILKPLQANAYKDVTTGQFEAMWMANTGLYSGSQVTGEDCFCPEETVSRGDFLAMAMKLLEVPVEKNVGASGFADEGDAVSWLQPYLATAMRLGIVSGSERQGEVVFRPNDPVTGAEAAVILENILQLPINEALETDAPGWAEAAVQAMSGAGIAVDAPGENMNRLGVAQMLYAVSKVAEQAPGLEVFQSGN